jgi:hypothetical protein
MKYSMFIHPIEGNTYFECEAESKEEAIEIGQEFANNNLCYGVVEETVCEEQEQSND